MSRGINKVIIVGNLGNDPDQRSMPNGNAVTNISVATSESWKDKQTGQQNEKTEWHRVVMFNRLAEVAGQYLHKGSKVYIEGKLQTRKWQDNNGQDRYTTEIVANELQMLDSQQGGQQQQQQGGQQQQPGQQQQQRQQQAPQQQQQSRNNTNGTQQSTSGPQNQQEYQSQAYPENNGVDDFSDDIPF